MRPNSNGGRCRATPAALMIAVAAALKSKSFATITLLQFQSEAVAANKFILLILEAVEVMMAVMPAVLGCSRELMDALS